MTPAPSFALEDFVALNLAKCLQKILAVSTGDWKLLGARTSGGTLVDALKQCDGAGTASAVWIGFKGKEEMAAVMLFDDSAAQCAADCFTARCLPAGAAAGPTQEEKLAELGNVLLNCCVNAPLNALRKSSMPGVPVFIGGDLRLISAELAKVIDPARHYRIISSTVAVRCGANGGRCEVFALLPEEMALELERLQPAAVS